jgi:predicted secreted acid phosphatase
VDGATKYLDKAMKKGGLKPKPKPKGGPSNAGTPAILLDIDDTTLNTYNYEIYSNFVFNPAQNAAFVNGALFPAVPGMPALVSHAISKGYQVFFLTGRPEAQRPGTVTNLTNAGYPTPAANHLYLKDQVNQPWLSSCSPTCTTIQYKSLTRQHIESTGVDIVANFGDQFSDLSGGFGDKTFKVPNPMYFLP